MTSPFWEAVSFYAVAALIIISAIGVVAMRNIVHCAMALATSFMGVACVYILLHAFFLFGVQILIYVGAITVLILFGIMLTRDVDNAFIQQKNRQSTLGLVASLATFVALTNLAVTGHFSSTQAVPGESVLGIGMAFVTTYVIPFELASVVLLVALVGAIVIARDQEVD